MTKPAVLLLAHGTPDTIEEIPAYLANVTSGRPLPPAVVAEIQHRYSLIGRSPLTELTMRQAELARRFVAQDTLHLGQIERLMAQAAVERVLWLERTDLADSQAALAQSRRSRRPSPERTSTPAKHPAHRLARATTRATQVALPLRKRHGGEFSG